MPRSHRSSRRDRRDGKRPARQSTPPTPYTGEMSCCICPCRCRAPLPGATGYFCDVCMAGEHQGPPPGDAWAPAIVEGSLFSPLGPGSGGLGVSLEDLERGVRFLDQDGSISGPTGGGGGGRVVSRGGVSDPNGGAGGGEGSRFPQRQQQQQQQQVPSSSPARAAASSSSAQAHPSSLLDNMENYDLGQYDDSWDTSPSDFQPDSHTHTHAQAGPSSSSTKAGPSTTTTSSSIIPGRSSAQPQASSSPSSSHPTAPQPQHGQRQQSRTRNRHLHQPPDLAASIQRGAQLQRGIELQMRLDRMTPVQQREAALESFRAYQESSPRTRARIEREFRRQQQRELRHRDEYDEWYARPAGERTPITRERNLRQAEDMDNFWESLGHSSGPWAWGVDRLGRGVENSQDPGPSSSTSSSNKPTQPPNNSRNNNEAYPQKPSYSSISSTQSPDSAGNIPFIALRFTTNGSHPDSVSSSVDSSSRRHGDTLHYFVDGTHRNWQTASGGFGPITRWDEGRGPLQDRRGPGQTREAFARYVLNTHAFVYGREGEWVPIVWSHSSSTSGQSSDDVAAGLLLAADGGWPRFCDYVTMDVRRPVMDVAKVMRIPDNVACPCCAATA